VNQVLGMTTITSGNFFNANCDVVDYSTAHILTYLVAGLNELSIPLLFVAFLEKSFP
jgi:hypothetical protein